MEFRPMRRIRQQLSEEESLDILTKATSGVLALSGDNGYPYAVPLSHVYNDGICISILPSRDIKSMPYAATATVPSASSSKITSYPNASPPSFAASSSLGTSTSSLTPPNVSVPSVYSANDSVPATMPGWSMKLTTASPAFSSSDSTLSTSREKKP